MTIVGFISSLAENTGFLITHIIQDGYVHLTVLDRGCKMRFNIVPSDVEQVDEEGIREWAALIAKEMRLERSRRPCVNCNE